MIKRTVRNKYKRFVKQVDSLTVLIHTRSHPMPIIDLYKKVYNPYTYIHIHTRTQNIPRSLFFHQLFFHSIIQIDFISSP